MVPAELPIGRDNAGEHGVTPHRLHEAARRVRRGIQQKMAEFVGDGAAHQDVGIQSEALRCRDHPVREDRRQPAAMRVVIDQ